MDLKMNWGEAASATGGSLLRGDPRRPFASLATDSRRLDGGQAFWALKGERHDAHDFLGAEGAARCAGWVVARGAPLPEKQPPAVLAVSDTRAALALLAAAHRSRFRIPVVGITGSNGKTTVKEMLRAILATRGQVCANAGNLNNEIGLPLSILELDATHAFAVFEMGASRPGDIRALARAAQPTAGVLTNIGPAHLEFFKSLEGTLKGKAELIDALPPGGPAILNADDPLLARLAAGLERPVLLFGATERPGLGARALHPPAGPATGITLEVAGKRVQVPGEHYGSIHRMNAAAAAAAALSLGFTPAEIEAGLRAFQPAPLRFAVRRHPSGAVFVVDAYNANPASMRAGIETFLETFPGGSRIVVLGDMKELGPESAAMHAELGRWVGRLPLSAAFLTGELMTGAAAAAAAAERFPVVHTPDAAALREPLRSLLQPGTAVYFKASRALALERLVEELG
ncbi:MAG TPA: UDP-N-acetylmuramoyl-tripeptide--D-alanyl-D-alanine ligase [Elusimicrobia bacterium]|nr:UDP-N-acetylmuramoyl-tripeptide--D-alanyl-D-alanine ligase [Elusimicrobiota bacterium]